MEERTGWRRQNESQIIGEEKRNSRLVGAAKTSRERAEWRRLQRKNLSILGLPKTKEWPQCHRESSWQERRSRPCQKEKEQSHDAYIARVGRSPINRQTRIMRDVHIARIILVCLLIGDLPQFKAKIFFLFYRLVDSKVQFLP